MNILNSARGPRATEAFCPNHDVHLAGLAEPFTFQPLAFNRLCRSALSSPFQLISSEPRVIPHFPPNSTIPLQVPLFAQSKTTFEAGKQGIECKKHLFLKIPKALSRAPLIRSPFSSPPVASPAPVHSLIRPENQSTIDHFSPASRRLSALVGFQDVSCEFAANPPATQFNFYLAERHSPPTFTSPFNHG